MRSNLQIILNKNNKNGLLISMIGNLWMSRRTH